MKKIKLLLLTFFMGLYSTGLYAFTVPEDRTATQAQSLDDIGVRVFTTTPSFNPVPVLLGPATGTAFHGSSLAVYAVLLSTIHSTAYSDVSYFELRAATIANNITDLLVPHIHGTTNTANTFIRFDPPIVVPHALSIRASTGGITASIFYNWLTTRVAGNFFIPRDQYQDKPVHDSDFYGTAVSSQVILDFSATNGVGTEALDNNSDELQVRASSTNRVAGFFTGFFPSTGAPGNYAIFRDTHTTGSEIHRNLLIVPILYQTITGYDLDRFVGGRPFSFPWPIRFENGLTVQLNTTQDKFRVFTRPQNKLR